MLSYQIRGCFCRLLQKQPFFVLFCAFYYTLDNTFSFNLYLLVQIRKL